MNRNPRRKAVKRLRMSNGIKPKQRAWATRFCTPFRGRRQLLRAHCREPRGSRRLGRPVHCPGGHRGLLWRGIRHRSCRPAKEPRAAPPRAWPLVDHLRVSVLGHRRFRRHRRPDDGARHRLDDCYAGRRPRVRHLADHRRQVAASHSPGLWVNQGRGWRDIHLLEATITLNRHGACLPAVVVRWQRRFWSLWQTWRACRTSSGHAAWHGRGLVVSFNPSGNLEVLDTMQDVSFELRPGEPPDGLL